MGNPRRLPSKVMVTMTSLTADDDPPRCHPNIICTTNTSKSLRESIASKDGTCGIDSSRYPHRTFLREIPTRISPSDPTADSADRHDDDDAVDRLPHQTHPFSTNENTSDPLIPFPQPDTEDYINRTLDNIQKRMRSWSSHIAINHDPRDITCTTPHHPSSSFPPAPLSTADGPNDTGAKLEEIAAKVEQMSRRWRSTIAANSPTGDDSHTPSYHSGPSPPATLSDDGLVNASTRGDNAAISEKEEEPVDPSLLAAVHSLDNFLLKYPRPIEPTDAHDYYQPSPARRLSLRRNALLAQQTLVLSTVTVILGELHKKLSHFIATTSRPKQKPTAITVPLQFSPKTMRNPATSEFQLSTKPICHSQQPIPAKPPFTSFTKQLRLYRTKDHLRPP